MCQSGSAAGLDLKIDAARPWPGRNIPGDAGFLAGPGWGLMPGPAGFMAPGHAL